MALADISLEIREGEFVCVMGPSGCGKSTLLNIVAMLDTPTSGRYALGEVEVSDASEAQLAEIRKGNIGFIFQNFMLIDDLSVYENVELPLLCLNVPRNERQTRVREVLELVDLQRRAKHRPVQLSGGQQQRAAIARAVVGNPKLIVADEAHRQPRFPPWRRSHGHADDAKPAGHDHPDGHTFACSCRSGQSHPQHA
jgi:putative ABC transport system ATP-binding protein